MLYSSVGFLGLIISIIINRDILSGDPEKKKEPAYKSYVALQAAVTVYYITDILWGILYERKLTTLVFADTTVYFIAMAASVLLWTWYVIDYLNEDNIFGVILESTGWLLFGFEMIIVVVNVFFPVVFWLDEAGQYHTAWGRNATLVIQIIMFFMAAVYAFASASKTRGRMRFRNKAIGLYSLAMIGFTAAQVMLPLLPMYAAGCVSGCFVLHGFAREDKSEENEDKPMEESKDD